MTHDMLSILLNYFLFPLIIFFRWFGISRNTTSWMAPRQGRGYFKLDVAAILCSFINANGDHLIVFGISGFENVMTIFGDNNEGAMMIKVCAD